MRVSHGLYLLAAVIVADTDADQHRAALRALLLRGSYACTGATKAPPAAAS